MSEGAEVGSRRHVSTLGERRREVAARTEMTPGSKAVGVADHVTHARGGLHPDTTCTNLGKHLSKTDRERLTKDIQTDRNGGGHTYCSTLQTH